MPQWVCWRLEQKPGQEKFTKVPYAPLGGYGASTTKPADWSTFEAAVQAWQFNGNRYNGIGFVFSDNDDFAGVDLDHVRDKETGRIEPWALEEIARLNSYTEVSQSKTGIHILLKAKVGKTGRKTPVGINGQAVEAYDRARYFCTTGEWLQDMPPTVEHRQEAVDAFLAKFFPPPKPKEQLAPPGESIKDLSVRAREAEKLLGPINWISDNEGLCRCPGERMHTTGASDRDIKVYKVGHKGEPTITCFHTNCKPIINALNYTYRSEVGKAEYVRPPAQAAPPPPVPEGPLPPECQGIDHNPDQFDGYDIPGSEQTAPKLTLPPIEAATILVADETAVFPPEIIQGVLHKGLKGVLGSASKARKSWIIVGMAVCVNAGIPFWKWPTHRCRVLLINFEIPRPFIRYRIQAVARHLSVEDLSNLDVWTLRGKAAALWKLLPAMLEHIKGRDYGLVIIDPIYKGLGGREENSAGAISDVCNEVETICVETGASVFYAAHYSKGNQSAKEAIDRISGSGVWGRDADTMICMTALQVENAYSIELILRNCPEQNKFAVSWDFPLMVERPDLDPSKLKKVAGRPPKVNPDDVLMLLPPSGLSAKDWCTLVVDELSVCATTFQDARRELIRLRRIRRDLIAGRWVPVGGAEIHSHD
jgi:hypothetical protein